MSKDLKKNVKIDQQNDPKVVLINGNSQKKIEIQRYGHGKRFVFTGIFFYCWIFFLR